MSGRSRFVIAAAIALLLALGAGAALAAGSATGDTNAPTVVDDDGDEASHAGDLAEDQAEGPDQPITGPDRDRAADVALEYLGGGRVTGTEIEDEESYYEIEVTRADGTQVDVQLDEFFEVVGTD